MLPRLVLELALSAARAAGLAALAAALVLVLASVASFCFFLRKETTKCAPNINYITRRAKLQMHQSARGEFLFLGQRPSFVIFQRSFAMRSSAPGLARCRRQHVTETKITAIAKYRIGSILGRPGSKEALPPSSRGPRIETRQSVTFACRPSTDEERKEESVDFVASVPWAKKAGHMQKGTSAGTREEAVLRTRGEKNKPSDLFAVDSQYLVSRRSLWPLSHGGVASCLRDSLWQRSRENPLNLRMKQWEKLPAKHRGQGPHSSLDNARAPGGVA